MMQHKLLENRIQGLLPVVQVSWAEDGGMEWGDMEKQVNWLLGECGASGLVIGMVSEVLRMTERERDELVERLVGLADGRGPVVMSVGGESTAIAQRNARAAERLGSAGMMAIPPALTRVDRAGLLEYYAGILEVTEIPLVVQDASNYVGTEMGIEVQGEVWKMEPERVGFKPEAAPVVENMQRLQEWTNGQAPCYEGMGGRDLVEQFPLGIVGTMPGADIPWAIGAIWRAMEKGESTLAEKIQGVVRELIQYCEVGLDGFLSVEKFLLKEQGIFGNRRVRGPVGYRLEGAEEGAVKEIYDRLRGVCER